MRAFEEVSLIHKQSEMNINIQKVSEVVIKDANGKVTQRFKLGMASLIKMQDKSQVLELGIAPEERPISKWKHKEGDTVVGVNHRWGIERSVEGTVTQMTESKFLLVPTDEKEDKFWCFNANVQRIVK